MNREELLKQAKPVLFNTEMVIAILEGRKTVTRRLVKPNSKKACGFFVTFRKSDGAFMGVYDYDENERMFENSQKPPYAVGDYLYVRETWSDHYIPDEDGKPKLEYCYKADGIDLKAECLPGETNRWYPSIHMPKEAARIFLKVTDVRVERLQDIMKSPHGPNNQVVREGCTYGCDFIAVWESTIKKSEKDTYGWDANPWVWVIEFERVEG